MPEIVTTKNRHGETRYGWRCECGRAAGAWPNRETAEKSARTHDLSTVYVNGGREKVPYCEAKRAAA